MRESSANAMFIGSIEEESDDSMLFHFQSNDSNDEYLQCLGDTGAQMHVFKSDKCMTNAVVNKDSKFIGCAGSESPVTKQADIVLGTRHGDDLTLNNISLVPGCSKNIVSMTQLILKAGLSGAATMSR